MRRLKTLIASGVITALAVSALAVPASAATKGQANIVNGIPGQKIDVCIGKTELRSALRYGAVYKKRVLGSKKFTFRKAGPGRCTGKIIIARRVSFPGGSDKTIVVTSKSPGRVMVFNNTGVGDKVGATGTDGALVLRHAADLGSNMVHFWNRVWTWDGTDYQYDVSALASTYEFEKGNQRRAKVLYPIDEDLAFQIMVTRLDDTTVLAKTPIMMIEPMTRYEFIFVGTNPSNARLVRFTGGI